MNVKQLKAVIKKGEDSSCQFKADIRNIDSLASEMAAFANSEGGSILIGVHDDGSIPGLAYADVARINQMISNAASQHVKSPLHVRTENVVLTDDKIVIVLDIPKGLDKPYFDKDFDFTINPTIFEPVIQIMYEIKVKYTPKPKEDKEKPTAKPAPITTTLF